ncbi:hypothetical protein BV25DRAFT_1180333 [Artomyces pyxidatus]|uniref:Uncharacterized protein n=1 Tax=Artomyces pyxidatus TaxID=48021 RepID=A0ACB8SS23_9AGAM|nr:hypothetical protein BV25DRAFT_1180333 [Artomyces pyxidatus]
MKINGHALNDVQYSSSACHEWTRLQAGMLVSSESTVGSLSFSDPRCEVHALFYDSRTFFAALIALFVAETTTLCVLVGLVGPTTVVNSHCLVTSISDLFTVYWCVFPRLVSSPNADNSVRRAVSLSFQSLLFALTLFKFFVAVRAGWGRTSVLARLATDGTWAYALIFSVMFANALLYSFEHTPLAGLCFSWLLTVLSISGSRLLLDPRRMFKFKHGNGPTINTTEMEMTTSMQFAEA